MKSKLNYSIGDWFAVPLSGHTFAVGNVARASKKGRVLFGYFFGPRLALQPDLTYIDRLTPSDCVKRLRFGDLYLIDGRWPVLGRQAKWDDTQWRTQWPMYEFVQVSSLIDKIYVTQYCDDDPSKRINKRVGGDEDLNLDKNILCGAGYVEGLLDDLL